MNIYSESRQAPPPPPRPPISRARAGCGGRDPGLLKVEPRRSVAGAVETWRCLLGSYPCRDARFCTAVRGLRQPGTIPGCARHLRVLQGLPAKSQPCSSSLSGAQGCLGRGFPSLRGCPRDSPPGPGCALPHPLARVGDGAGARRTRAALGAAQRWGLCPGRAGDTGTSGARTAALTALAGAAQAVPCVLPSRWDGGEQPPPRQVDTVPSRARTRP